MKYKQLLMLINTWNTPNIFRYVKGLWQVWYVGLIYKLNPTGVPGDLLELIKMSLNVLLNDRTSDWLRVKAGVSQGFILRPLLFLICINDLLDHLVSSVKFSADDTSLFSTVYDTNASKNILNDFLKKY